MEPYAALGGHCPLMARKFLPDTSQAVLNLITDCKTRLRITVLEDCLDRAARRLHWLQSLQLDAGGVAGQQGALTHGWAQHTGPGQGKGVGRRRALQAAWTGAGAASTQAWGAQPVGAPGQGPQLAEGLLRAEAGPALAVGPRWEGALRLGVPELHAALQAGAAMGQQWVQELWEELEAPGDDPLHRHLLP